MSIWKAIMALVVIWVVLQALGHAAGRFFAAVDEARKDRRERR